MNKIANWVFGSFFRTIGRVLVFIILGVIIANFIDFGSLKDNFSITDLFLDKVNAKSTYDNAAITWTDINCNNVPWVTGSGNIYQGYQVQMPSGSQEISDGTFSFFFGSTACQTSGSYRQFDESTSYLEIFMYYEIQTNDESVSTYIDNSSSTGNNDYIVTAGGHELASINMTLRGIDGLYSTCHIESIGLQTVSWICPLTQQMKGKVNRVSVQYSIMRPNYGESAQIYPQKIKVGLQKSVMRYIEEDITSAIQQQTQQQQQQHQETQNYLEDTNTTSANSQGESFITNFNNNTHGLTGIITAPLNAIQSIASSTCSTLVLPLPFVKNKSLNLPCMSSIYSQYFGAFYTMYQGIILALISYWVCIRIFTLVKGFKDPDDDKIEVMDL